VIVACIQAYAKGLILAVSALIGLEGPNPLKIINENLLKLASNVEFNEETFEKVKF
jgi:hypothetical protein